LEESKVKKTYQSQCEEANDNPANEGNANVGIGNPQKFLICVCLSILAIVLFLYFFGFFVLGNIQ